MAAPDRRSRHDDHPVAFVGVTVMDVEPGVLISDRTVIINQGRIAGVAPVGNVELPGDAEQIDARGLYLIPALWDLPSCPQEGDPFISYPDDMRRWTEEAEQGLRVRPRIVGTASFMANGPGMRARLPDAPSFFFFGTESLRRRAAAG